MTVDLSDSLKKLMPGEISDDPEVLKAYSRDASIFEVRPKFIAYPKNNDDVSNLVRFVSEHKTLDEDLSLTVRAAGSDMSGGPLGESIIVDVAKHLNKIGEINGDTIAVQPGAYYRDFEVRTLEKGLMLPCYTASKNLCALGGMIGNNCAGEKTLRYGKMEDFIVESKWIFADGNEYVIKKGSIDNPYSARIFDLIKKNQKLIQDAKPKVSKNSAGYYLWNVCPSLDESDFDLNKLLVGSQGTLGIMTEATVRLVPVEPVSELFVIFLHDLKALPQLINTVLATNPDSVESYDSATMKLAMRFFPEMLRSMRPKHFFSLAWSFIPEMRMMIKGGIPRLILLIEHSGKTKSEVDQKMKGLEKLLAPYHLVSRKTISTEESEKYWTVRRESFNLLRKHVHGFRTAPFVDDVVVRPEDMPEFLPRMEMILDDYKLTYTIAGHAGNGNLHIIPLMDMKDKKNIEIIKDVGEKVYELVREYKGSITGEHNDGIVRTPYLDKMYSPEVLELFNKVKQIFDPQNIFNPGKKVNGTLEYLQKHIAMQ